MATSTTDTMAIGQSFSQPIPPGMRCVICIGDLALATRVQAAITECQGIVVVGRSADWRHCEVLIDEYCPELLVVSEDLWSANAGLTPSWPVVLRITSGSDDRRDELTIPETSTPDAFRRIFRQMQGRIIEQKSLELRELLSNYLEATERRYRDAFEVLDINTLRVIKVEDVAFISVDGNYAVLNTTAGVFKFRETLNNLAESLDPDRFARIHRSAIVNLSVVERFVEDPEGTALLLHDGTRLPVGPTFKGLETFPIFKPGH